MPNANGCPEAILAAIPWYPDALTPDECGAVEAHAADCRACRAELAFLRGDEEPSIEIPDSGEVYSRLLERIAMPDEEESETSTAALPGPLQRLSQRAARPVSIAAGLMVALVSGMLTMGTIWTVRVAPTYQTGSAASAAVSPYGQVVDVVFSPGMTLETLTAELHSVGASLVAGPTQRGVYRIRLAPDRDVEAALQELRGAMRVVVPPAEPPRG